jgi:hypothetical protein
MVVFTVEIKFKDTNMIIPLAQGREQELGKFWE